MSQAQYPTLFTQPIQTLYIFSIILFRYGTSLFKYLSRYWAYFVICFLIFVAPRFAQGFHSEYIRQFDEINYFMLYWLILGVMSSVGLGTGLHTFVLYMGPHIAKTTIQSYECNSIPLYIPNKYKYDYIECPSYQEGVTMIGIIKQIYLETVLFGIGTAIGELPPYFVAKAAALANKKLEELEEVDKAKHENTIMAKAKLLIYEKLQKNAFLTVLLCASIPNPLFDLAGLTCGHFLISFWTFFGATVLGKAFIKMHLQMIFVIVVFSQEQVKIVLGFIEKYIPFIFNFINDALTKQRQMLRDPSLFKEGEKPLIAQLWEYFIMAMIFMFIVSFINSLVAEHYHSIQHIRQQEKKHSHHSQKHHSGDHGKKYKKN